MRSFSQPLFSSACGVRTWAGLPLTAMTSALAQIRKLTLTPFRRFGPVPFWFWNDDLDRNELLRQLRAFHDAGCGGVIPHARVGLSRRIGYLSDTCRTSPARQRRDSCRRVVDAHVIWSQLRGNLSRGLVPTARLGVILWHTRLSHTDRSARGRGFARPWRSR